jgi:hypothetical protein
VVSDLAGNLADRGRDAHLMIRTKFFIVDTEERRAPCALSEEEETLVSVHV